MKTEKKHEKGVTDFILWTIILIFFLMVLVAVIYYGGIQMIQDFLKQNLIK